MRSSTRWPSSICRRCWTRCREPRSSCTAPTLACACCIDSVSTHRGKLFDTVIAARLTGVAKFGYSALVAEHFGITLPKGSQKANWARRPLAPKLAQYARNDTHFLLPLAELLERRLEDLGRLAWLEQSCQQAVAAARERRIARSVALARGRGSHRRPPPVSHLVERGSRRRHAASRSG